jgi:hypothetical protein
MFGKLIKITQKLNEIQAKEITLQKSSELNKTTVPVTTTASATPPKVAQPTPKPTKTPTPKTAKEPTLSSTMARTKSVLEPHYSPAELADFSQKLENHISSGNHAEALNLIHGAKQRVHIKTATKEILDHVHAGNWDQATSRVQSLMTPATHQQTASTHTDKAPNEAPGVTDPNATVTSTPENTSSKKKAALSHLHRKQRKFQLPERTDTLTRPEHIESKTPPEQTAMAAALEVATQKKQQEATPTQPTPEQTTPQQTATAPVKRTGKRITIAKTPTRNIRAEEAKLKQNVSGEQPQRDHLAGLTEEQRARLEQVKTEREQPTRDVTDLQNHIKELQEIVDFHEQHGHTNTPQHKELEQAIKELKQLQKPTESHQRTRNVA